MTDAPRYRPITVTGLQPVTPAEQAAPQLMWIDIDQLVIDNHYQRPLEQANIAAIRRIAENFRWDAFNTIKVAPIPGGLFAVVDGQHRVHAARLCGFAQVPAVSVLLSASEQARAFVEINTRQIKISPHQIYRAALVAAEPWAIECRDAVAAAGCRLMDCKFSTKNKKPRQVFAIGLIRDLVRAGDGWAVTAGLRALTSIDKGTDVAMYDGSLLMPWLHAVAATDVARDLDLGAFLSRIKPWLVIEAATRVAEQERRNPALVRREAFGALMRKAAIQPAPDAPAAATHTVAA